MRLRAVVPAPLGAAHAPSPDVRCGHPALRSLNFALASPSWLRSAANAGSWGTGSPSLAGRLTTQKAPSASEGDWRSRVIRRYLTAELEPLACARGCPAEGPAFAVSSWSMRNPLSCLFDRERGARVVSPHPFSLPRNRCCTLPSSMSSRPDGPLSAARIHERRLPGSGQTSHACFWR